LSYLIGGAQLIDGVYNPINTAELGSVRVNVLRLARRTIYQAICGINGAIKSGFDSEGRGAKAIFKGSVCNRNGGSVTDALEYVLH
jgi:hypothetical protein